MTALYTTHAALYDAAFDWDVAHEVAAIASISGIDRGRVLEPMCGPARLLRGFARAGFETVGIDLSPEMLALARAHYEQESLAGSWACADATDFSIDGTFDLAVCPINSLGHLLSERSMLAHLECVAKHLRPGSSYWVQLDLRRPGTSGESEAWEFEYEAQTMRVEWVLTGEKDGIERHLTRFAYPDGRLIEDESEMKVWSFATWTRVLAPSSFDLAEAYAGGTFAPRPVDPSLDGGHVFWQRLVRR